MIIDSQVIEILLIALLSFLSALVTSIVGFGAGLVLTPLLTFFMPLKQALGIGALIYLVTSSSKTWWYRGDIDFKLYRKALPMAFVGLVSGMIIIQHAPVTLLEIIFASVLIWFAISNLLGQSASKSLLPQFCYPLLAGTASILVHAAGVFFYRYCRLNALDRVATVATMAALHFTLNIFKAIFFTTSGFVASSAIVTLFPAYILAVIGTRMGRTILTNYVSERGFSIAVSITLIILALRMLWHAIHAIG